MFFMKWLAAVIGLAVFSSTTAARAFAAGPAAAEAWSALVIVAVGQWPPRFLVDARIKRMKGDETRRSRGEPLPALGRLLLHRLAVAWGALIGVALGLIVAFAVAGFTRHR